MKNFLKKFGKHIAIGGAIILAIFLSIPGMTSAIATQWDRYIVGGIRPLVTTDKVLIGGTSTTTGANLEVQGSFAIASSTGGCTQASPTGVFFFTGIPCGTGTGSSATTTIITQTSHGFSGGEWVGLSNNVYALTNAVAGGVYQVVGLVKSVTDANTFVLQTGGDFTDTNLIPGMAYYLSASTTPLGTIVGYPPTTVGQISAPVALARTQTGATINIGRPSIVAQSTSSFGINVGNDQISSTYYATSSNVSDAAIVSKNLANKQVRIALPSYNNPVGVYNMRELAKYYKTLGFSVSYGVTGLSGVQNLTTYNAWKAQVIATELPWACSNGINTFYLGNEEDWQAQIGNFGGSVTGDGARNDVRSMSSTARSYANSNGCSSMSIVYSTAEGTVAQWGALYPDFGALDKLGFNMYNTLSGFDAGVAYFQSQIGSKFFVSEWAANHPYYDMVNSSPFYTDAQYAADLASRQQTLNNRGVEAYFFALRYGGNTLISGNWNILLNTGVFLPGANAAFGGGAGNAVKNTPIVLIDNQKFYLNTVKTAYIDADSTDLRVTAPQFGSLAISGRPVVTANRSGFGTMSIRNADSAGYSSIDLRTSGDTSTGGLGYGNSSVPGFKAGSMYLGTNSSSIPLNLYTNDLQRLTILGGGNVGIGSTSPSTKLVVGGVVTVDTIVATSTTATSTIANLNGTLYAAMFPGADMCIKIQAAYDSFVGKGVNIVAPRGDHPCTSTGVNLGTNGKRATVEGVGVGGGTRFFWTGTGAMITINDGDQDTGVDHTSGTGVRNITIIGNSYSTTSPQIGIYVGGTNGTSGARLENVNLQHLGRCIETGANVYNFYWDGGTLRDCGQNGLVNTASNSGEGLFFNKIFAVDGANNNAFACFEFADYATISTTFVGGSFDDCQLKYGFQNMITMIGTHIERPSPAYGKYTPIVGGNSSYSMLNLIGVVIYNGASSSQPDEVVYTGGNVNISGGTVFKGSSTSIPNFVTQIGTGVTTWTGLNNNGGGVTNITTGYPFTSSGSTGITNLATLGIGTSTPVAKLEIVSALTDTLGLGALGISDGSSRTFNFRQDVTNADLQIDRKTGGSWSNMLTLKRSNGNLGIGSTTPGSLLAVGSTNGVNINENATSTFGKGIDIRGGCFSINGICVSGSGGSSASSTLLADFNTFSNTNNFTGKVGLASSTPWGQFSINSNALGSGVPEFVIGSSTATHLIVTGAGNVGIGTLTPVQKLTVSGSVYVTGGGNFFMDDDKAFQYGDGSAYVAGSGSGEYIRFFTNAVEAMRVTGAGVVAIGTSTSRYMLTVATSTAPQIVLSAGAGVAQTSLRSVGGNFYISTTTVAGTATTSVPAFTIIGSSGKVGIATSSPTSFVDINASGTGTVQAFAVRSTPGGSGTFGGNLNSIIFDNLSSGNWKNQFSLRAQGIEKWAIGNDVFAQAEKNFYIADSAGNLPFYIDASGFIQTYSGGIWGWNSDSGFPRNGTLDTGLSRISAGKVGVGTGGAASVAGTLIAANIGVGSTTPWRNLGVTGTVAINGLSSATGQNAVCINPTTKEVVDAGAGTCPTSSIFVKDITGKITLDVAKYIVKRLSGLAITFNYKGEDEQHYGFVAEEVAKIDVEVAEKFGVFAHIAEYTKEEHTNELTGHVFKKGDPVGVQYANISAIYAVYLNGLETSQSTGSSNVPLWGAVFILFLIVGYQGWKKK